MADVEQDPAPPAAIARSSAARDADPIFVLGVGRSGTTMLRFMLSTHPAIFIGGDSNFLHEIFPRGAPAVMSRRRAERAVEVVLRQRRFLRDWQGALPDPASFVAALPDLEPATFVDAIFGTLARQHGARRWGDKSNKYLPIMPTIAQMFPRARFVHLIRDGRDVALSILSVVGSKLDVDLYKAARRWRHQVVAARTAGAALGPGRYMELRYETLTRDPEPFLREVCTFVGETFDPAMARPHELASTMLRPTKGHALNREAPKPNERWRTQMSPADQRVFEAAAGDLLLELGYPAADLGPMPVGERARYAGLSAKFHTLEGGRRVLQTFGIFPPH